MNIIIFSAYFYPHQGGVEKFVKELFSNLQDIDVTIVTCNTENSKPYEQKFGFKIYRLNSWNLVGGNYPVVKCSGWKQLHVLDKEKFDYAITNTRFFHTSYVGYKFAKRNHIPLIHIEHGTTHSKVSNPLVSLINIIYDHTIGREIIKNADKAVCISKAAEEFSKHIYNRETILLHNCIDTKEIKKTDKASQSKLKKRLGIKNEKIIVFVGRLIYAKGVQDLLDATKDMQNIKVIIIGDGNYSAELRNKYTDKKFLFQGQKTIEDVIEYLSIADIFVNPSYGEGLPTSVLEAGSIGIPIIATDVGGTREIIEDGKNGYLIRPKDIDALRSRIKRLLQEKHTRQMFSKNIRKTVCEKFDWDISRKKLAAILKKNHK